MDEALNGPVERRIGAAIGLVMARLQVTYDDALHVLETLCERTGRTLEDVAEDVVQTGEFGMGA